MSILLAGAIMVLPPALFNTQVPLTTVPSVSREIVQPTPPPPTLEQEIHMLALALYFEALINESNEGLQAIASVIMNRVRSPYFGDSIFEVVTHGAEPGKTNGGCQFSFMCDQYPEDVEVLCQLRPAEMLRYWGENGCQNRFAAYLAFAKAYLANGQDNTNGSTMYYARSMKQPPKWRKDLIFVLPIGSHNFGASRQFLVATAKPK